MNAHVPFDKPVTIHEAKTHLSRLVAEAEAGREITIARGSKPVAKLVPLEAPKPRKRQLGLLRGESRGSDPLAYGFWDPIPDVDQALWDGDVDYPESSLSDAPPAA